MGRSTLLSAVWLIITFHSVLAQATEREVFHKKNIVAMMKKVCDWQLASLPDTALMSDGRTEPITGTTWHRAALFTGVMATYYTTKEKKYLRAAMELSEENQWRLGPRPRHADDHCIAQTYIELYFLKEEPQMIAHAIEMFDWIVAEPMPGAEVGWEKDKNWSWCDALFMAPPAFACLSSATGERKYLDAMNTMWWETTEHLYDEQEHLFYRDERYKIKPDGSGPRTKNGEKIFWGRGNGWVMAGTARVLQYVPPDFGDRTKYVKLFKEMAAKVASLQGEDGLWRSSLLDPEEFPAPETSCSGFFAYALAWGINNALLERDVYLPIVQKAWKGLIWAVDDAGKLGWVQRVGHDPRSVSKEDTMEYGVGAFLLAGSELVKLMGQ